MIAGAGNVVIFNRICSWGAGKVASATRRVAVCVFMVGSWSDHPRIILGSGALWNATSAVFCNSLRFGSVILRGRRSIW